VLLNFSRVYSQASDTLEGDLFFGFWRYGSLYKQDKKTIKWIEDLSKNNRRDTLQSNTQDILRIYDVLKKEEMLYFPYVQVCLDNDSIVRLYFQKKDYKKIQVNKLNDLIEKEEKVRMIFQVRELGQGLYYCEKLMSLNRIKGKTRIRPTKFAIEDYPR
jgi:hypothetical protein